MWSAGRRRRARPDAANAVWRSLSPDTWVARISIDPLQLLHIASESLAIMRCCFCSSQSPKDPWEHRNRLWVGGLVLSDTVCVPHERVSSRHEGWRSG